MVLCSHYGLSIFQSIGPWAVNLFCRGGEGVILFFVLSGFLMTVVYEKRGKGKLPAKDFYVARLARIYPLYVLALVLHYPFFILYVRQANFELLNNVFVAQAVVLLKFSMLDPFANALMAKTGWLLQGWSLGCELLFYLLFPLAAKSIYGIKDKWILPLFTATLFLAWLIHAAPLWFISAKGSDTWHIIDNALQFMPPARILDFIVGIFAGLAVLRFESIRLSLAKFCWGVLAFTLIFQAWSPVGLTSESWHLLIFRLMYVSLIASLYCLDRDKPYRETKIVKIGVVAGEISFGMYLFQGIVYDYIKTGLALGAGIQLSEAALFGVVVPTLIATCYYLHLRFETPMRERVLDLFKPGAKVFSSPMPRFLRRKSVVK